MRFSHNDVLPTTAAYSQSRNDALLLSSEKASAKIDFIFQSETNIVPLEVKAAENLQAKSLETFCQKYQPKYAIRTSMPDYRHEEWLTNVPLYDVLVNILKEAVPNT